jgi:hypothetical protein
LISLLNCLVLFLSSINDTINCLCLSLTLNNSLCNFFFPPLSLLWVYSINEFQLDYIRYIQWMNIKEWFQLFLYQITLIRVFSSEHIGEGIYCCIFFIWNLIGFACAR